MPRTEDPSTWRLVTTNGVRYRLVSRSGSFRPGGVDGKEEFLIQSSKLWLFVRSFFPLPNVADGQLPVITNKVMGGLQIRASSLEWEAATPGLPIDPFAVDDEAPSGTYHDLIKVTVQYTDDLESSSSGGGVSQDPDANDPTTFLKINAEAAGQFLHLPSPGSQWQDVNGNKEENRDPDAPVTLIVPMINWTLTWPMLSRKFMWDVMLDRLRAAQGKVNSKTFAPMNAAPETLLLGSWSIEDERQFLFDDELNDDEIKDYWVQNPVNLTIHMQEKRIVETETNNQAANVTVIKGHNHMWKPGKGWERFLYNGTDAPFQTHDFDEIFKIPE